MFHFTVFVAERQFDGDGREPDRVIPASRLPGEDERQRRTTMGVDISGVAQPHPSGRVHGGVEVRQRKDGVTAVGVEHGLPGHLL